LGRTTGTAQHVCLELHQGVVEHHTTVYLQGGQRHTGVGIHGVQHFAGLVSGGFQGGAGDVRFG
jgi:hypothetical protein